MILASGGQATVVTCVRCRSAARFVYYCTGFGRRTMSTDEASTAKKTAPAAEGIPRRSLLRRIADFFFGFDYFISYCPLDGKVYATSLYRQLVGRGYYCRFKIPPRRKKKDEGWDLLGRRALLKSQVLIVVGTKSSLTSPTVLREAKRFHRRRKQIIPISFDGTLDRSLPRKGLLEFIPSKLLRINATAAELATGPAPGATERLSRIFEVSRQSGMRSRLSLVLGVVFAVLAAIAGYQWLMTAGRYKHAKQDRYVSDMALVQSRWDSGDWSAVIPLLERHHPQNGPNSERGFEWSYRWLKLRMASPTLQVHSGEIQNLTCSPDGALLAASSRSGMVSIREMSSGKLISELENSSGAIVNAIAFSPGSQLVAGATDDKQVRLWDPLTGKQVKNWGVDKPSPSSIAFVNDGKTIQTESLKGVEFWNVESGARTDSISLEENGEPVAGPLVFCEDGRLLARLKKDHAVDIIVTKSKKTSEGPTARGDLPYMVEFSPDGMLLAVQTEDQGIHVRECTSGRELTSHDKPITLSCTLAFRNGLRLPESLARRGLRRWLDQSLEFPQR